MGPDVEDVAVTYTFRVVFQNPPQPPGTTVFDMWPSHEVKAHYLTQDDGFFVFHRDGMAIEFINQSIVRGIRVLSPEDLKKEQEEEKARQEMYEKLVGRGATITIPRNASLVTEKVTASLTPDGGPIDKIVRLAKPDLRDRPAFQSFIDEIERRQKPEEPTERKPLLFP